MSIVFIYICEVMQFFMPTLTSISIPCDSVDAVSHIRGNCMSSVVATVAIPISVEKSVTFLQQRALEIASNRKRWKARSIHPYLYHQGARRMQTGLKAAHQNRGPIQSVMLKATTHLQNTRKRQSGYLTKRMGKKLLWLDFIEQWDPQSFVMATAYLSESKIMNDRQRWEQRRLFSNEESEY